MSSVSSSMEVSATRVSTVITALLDHIDPVAEGEKVGVVVVDDDHRHPAGGKVPDQLHDQGRLLGPHSRQGLVEQQDLRVLPGGAGDGDGLALAPGKHLDLAFEVGDAHLDVVQVFASERPHAPAGEEAEPAQERDFAVEEQVLVNGQLGYERQVLVNGLDPVGTGILHRVEV